MIFLIFISVILLNNVDIFASDDALSLETSTEEPFEADPSWANHPIEEEDQSLPVMSDVPEEIPEVHPDETTTVTPSTVEKNIKNETISNKTVGTKNETDSKISCTPRVLADGQVPNVVVVNMTSLTENLNPRGGNSAAGECALVLFYSPWCPFSERAAPHFTALARAFPHISLYAVDALAHSNSLQMKYGLVAVPTILLFHNGRAIAKFNDSVPTLSKLSVFVSRITGAAALKGVEVETSDESPEWFPPVQPRSDPVLWLAWAFTLTCGGFFFSRSTLFHRLLDSLLNAWREAQHEHEE